MFVTAQKKQNFWQQVIWWLKNLEVVLHKQYLAENDIQTNIHYPIPPHKQECYKEWNDLSFPITELIHAEELSIPMSPVISMEEVERVVKVLNAWK